MLEIGIDLSGLEEALEGKAEEYQGRVARGLQLGGQALVREAKQRAPVDTGMLKRSIHSVLEADGEETVVRVGTNVEYAIHVEYGHRTRGGRGYVPGRYFLKGAFDSRKTGVLRAVSRTIMGR